MRYDEVKAINVLESKFLAIKYHDYSIVYGNRNEPPDFKLIIKDKIINIEITQLYEKFKDTNTKIKTIIMSLSDFSDILNQKFADLLPDNLHLNIEITIPLINLKSFKRELTNFINDYLIRQPTKFNEKSISLTLASNNIKINIKFSPSGKKITIFSIVDGKNHEYKIEDLLKTSIIERIEEKEKRLSLLTESEKWLVLLNQYQLATKFSFELVFKDAINMKSFNKIFVVLNNDELMVFEATTI